MQYYWLENEDGEILAHIIVFDDGQTVVKWRGENSGIVVHRTFEEVKVYARNGICIMCK